MWRLLSGRRMCSGISDSSSSCNIRKIVQEELVSSSDSSESRTDFRSRSVAERFMTATLDTEVSQDTL